MDSTRSNTLDTAVIDNTQSGFSVGLGIQEKMKKSFFARLEAASYVLADDLMLAQHRLFLEWDHLELDEFLRDVSATALRAVLFQSRHR